MTEFTRPLETARRRCDAGGFLPALERARETGGDHHRCSMPWEGRWFLWTSKRPFFMENPMESPMDLGSDPTNILQRRRRLTLQQDYSSVIHDPFCDPTTGLTCTGLGAKSKPLSNCGRIWDTIWVFNIAMENGPFIDGSPIKNGDFPWLC